MDSTDFEWEDCVVDLPLDTSKTLPPLDALSSTSSTHLPHIDLLNLIVDEPDAIDFSTHDLQKPSRLCTPPPPHPMEETLSPLTMSPPLSHSPPLSLSPPPPPPNHTSSQSSATHAAPYHSLPPPLSSSPPLAPILTDQSQLVLELSTRLASAGAEATALRKRVASLSAENRCLRAALDHANARLIAVAQAAAAHPPAASPVMLGLAHVTTDVASRLAGALTVSDTSLDDSPRDRKKRKRMTGAATTMACVMFMWGAFCGTPAWLSSSASSSRSEGNLPAVWKGREPSNAMANVRVPNVVRHERDWQPNCMRVLEQLPDASQPEGAIKEEEEVSKVIKGEPMIIDNEDVKMGEPRSEGLETDSKMFVDVEDKASANVVARADLADPRHPQYSYVLCRDAQSAIANVKSCASKMRNGQPCGMPHTISLILPAEAAGIDDNDTDARQPALAEVQCSITAVARIPVEAVESVDAKGDSSPYGRVIASVPETLTVVRDH